MLVLFVCGGLGNVVGYSVYCLLKVGIDLLVKILVVEWGGYGIWVNVLVLMVFWFVVIEWMFIDDLKGWVIWEVMFVWILLCCFVELEDFVGVLIYLFSDVLSFYIG